jgi:hypothetical protein
LVRALGARWSFTGRIEVLEGDEDATPLERDPLLRQVADLFDASVVRVQRSSPASS